MKALEFRAGFDPLVDDPQSVEELIRVCEFWTGAEGQKWLNDRHTRDYVIGATNVYTAFLGDLVEIKDSLLTD